MIYIYAGIAFVLAGGGWFIGWHGGYRQGRRGRNLDEYRTGYIDAITFNRRPTLSDQIHDHLEIMDADE